MLAEDKIIQNIAQHSHICRLLYARCLQHGYISFSSKYCVTVTQHIAKSPWIFQFKLQRVLRIYIMLKCGKDDKSLVYFYFYLSFFHVWLCLISQQWFIYPTKFWVIRQVSAFTTLSLYHIQYEFLGINMNFVSAMLWEQCEMCKRLIVRKLKTSNPTKNSEYEYMR